MAIDNRLQIFDENGNPVDYDIMATDVKFADGKDLPTKLDELEDEIGEGGYTPPEGGIPKTDLAPAVQQTLDDVANKVDKVTGYGLSKNDYTDTDKAKVNSLKPVATSGSYNDLTDKPTIPTGQVTVTTNGDGTFTIHSGENDYTINLNHTHPNMAKLVVCEESDLPSTLDPATIYAITDSGETEIEKLIIRGMEFVGGGVPDTGEPMISSPSNGSTINLGDNTSGQGVSKTITIKGKNLTGDLTVAVGTGLTISYGQTLDGSSVTIPMAQALLGAQVTISYAGSGALDDGSLVISHGNDVLSSVVVVVVVAPVQVAGVKLTGTQWLETDYHINANTKITLRGTFAANSVTDSTNDFYYMSCDSYNNQGRPTLYVGKNDSTTYNFCAVFGGNPNPAIKAVAKNVMVTPDSTIEIYGSTVKFTPNGGSAITLNVPNSLGSYENPLKIGHYLSKDGTNSSIFKSFDLTIYELTISEGNETKRHYVPATLQGVPGLHDTVTGAFISSKTSTELEVVQ